MPILIAFLFVLVFLSPMIAMIVRNELKWARRKREEKRKLDEGTACAFELRAQVYRSGEAELLLG